MPGVKIVEEDAIRMAMASAVAGQVRTRGLDNLGDEFSHGEFDMKFDQICDRVEFDVSINTH